MKVRLMHREADFDAEQRLPWNAKDLVANLELTTLFNAMAGDDKFVFGIAKTALLSSLRQPGAIRYRQDVLKDCLDNPATVDEIFAIAADAVTREKKHFHFGSDRNPSALLRRSVEVLEMFVELLEQLRHIAERRAPEFASDGFTGFFSRLVEELDDAYLASVRNQIKELEPGSGVLISAQLGPANKGVDYTLRKPPQDHRSWVDRLFASGPPSHTFHIDPRDESGNRALSDLENKGLSRAANALGQSAEHILGFFKRLRVELAFYQGCSNLHAALAEKNTSLCFPAAVGAQERRHVFTDLQDVCLTLSMDTPVIGNDLDASERGLAVITGANQGGKSTFLRSIGLSQMMMQAGMFVAADSFTANTCAGLFTHYRREEDSAMESGKFDEELARMSEIVDHITPDSMLLCNESLASTNEREGSEIASQIVGALLEKRISVFFVTHFYELANTLRSDEKLAAVFLRADRQADGRRTFKLVEGEPLPTGHGQDLYDRIFGEHGCRD